jgi:hypothetical protein
LKNKDHRKAINAEGEPIVITENAIGDTSGAAPIVNGHLSNGGDDQRIKHPEEQSGHDCRQCETSFHNVMGSNVSFLEKDTVEDVTFE